MILLAYFSALITLVLVDALWIAFYARVLFKPALGDIARDKPRWIPAGMFYLLYPAGIVFFAVLPALDTASLVTVLERGALFGFFVYMTYDLTNLASIEVWTVKLALLDIVWGTFLTALVAAASAEVVLLLH